MRLITISTMCLLSMAILCEAAANPPRRLDLVSIDDLEILAADHVKSPRRTRYIQEVEPLTWDVAIKKGSKVWNELQDALEDNPRDKSTEVKFEYFKSISRGRFGISFSVFKSKKLWTVLNSSPISLPKDLTDVFQSLNISWYLHNFYMCAAKRDHKNDMPTWYQNIYNPKDGILIAFMNERAKKEMIPWSEVTFELYSGLAKCSLNPVSNLKWIIRHNIENYNTKHIVDEAYSTIGIKPSANLQSWTLRNNRDAFYALLGTVNGKGVAHILKDYTKSFDRTTIHEIFTVQRLEPDNNDLVVHMIFRLGPAYDAANAMETVVDTSQYTWESSRD